MPITTFDSQVEAFLRRLPYVSSNPDIDEPSVIFRGALELTREQEEAMVTSALDRIKKLRDELGRDDSFDHSEGPAYLDDKNRVNLESMGWMQKRQFFRDCFAQRFGWRRGVDGVFERGSNPHVPIIYRVVHQMIARAQTHFLGSPRWCSARPVGQASDDMANACDEFVQAKMRETNVRSNLMGAIKSTAIQGECVVKTSYREMGSSYETFARVLVDSSNEPIIAEDGDYIFEADQWKLVDGAVTLSRDGRTTLAEPPDPQGFVEMKVRRRVTTESGPVAEVVGYKDFLAPLNAADLQQADTVVHYYEATAIEIVEQFIARMKAAGRWDAGEYPRVMEYLRTASSNTTTSHLHSGNARSDLGERSQDLSERGEPVIRIAEVYRWFDATQSGNRDNIYMLIDLETSQPLLYDHVANVHPGGKRPFTALTWWPVEGRWDGISAVDVFLRVQELIDLLTARWELSESKSGSVTFFDPSQTTQGRLNPKLDPTKVKYLTKIDPLLADNQILSQVRLNEWKGGDLNGLIQFFLQMATNMSGVANANDAAAAGLDTSELATGVRNIEASGNEMFAPILVNLEPPITAIATNCQVLAVDNMNDEEAFVISGPRGVLMLKQLKAADARAFRWNVSLEVASDRGQRDVAEAQATTGAISEYVDLMLKIYSAPVPFAPGLVLGATNAYRQRLRAHGVQDVDKVLPLPDEDAMTIIAQPREPAVDQAANSATPTSATTAETTP
jgi:hypothetical protein